MPGTYVEGRFQVSKQQSVVVIPSSVVVYRGNNQSVYIVDGNKARQVNITTGEGRDGRVIVTSGLKAGDKLITSGNRVLYDDAEIVIKKVDLADKKTSDKDNNKSNEG